MCVWGSTGVCGSLGSTVSFFLTCFCTSFLRHGFSLVLELDGLARVAG